MSFLKERDQWRLSLAGASEYRVVVEKIKTLEEAIAIPATRVLLQQVLADVRASPTRDLQHVLAREIATFAVPSVNFRTPPMPDGWEYGTLDLVALRRVANDFAQRIPMQIHTMASAAA